VAPLTAMCDQVLDSDQPASDLAEEQVSIYVFCTVYICVLHSLYMCSAQLVPADMTMEFAESNAEV
jgi:hypothetical protein